MGKAANPATFGHFGGSGTFLWVDPDLDRAAVALADREFDEWALAAWIPFNDALLAELRAAHLTLAAIWALPAPRRRR